MAGIGTYSASRKAVYDAFVAAKDNWLVPDANIVEAPLPVRYTKQELLDAPLVHVVALGYDESAISRGRSDRGTGVEPGGRTSRREVTVQTIIMRHIPTDDTGGFDMDLVDEVLDFKEQLADICKTVRFYSHTWIRNYELRDAQGLPYSYDLARESNMIQAYINAAYEGVK